MKRIAAYTLLFLASSSLVVFAGRSELIYFGESWNNSQVVYLHSLYNAFFTWNSPAFSLELLGETRRIRFDILSACFFGFFTLGVSRFLKDSTYEIGDVESTFHALSLSVIVLILFGNDIALFSILCPMIWILSTRNIYLQFLFVCFSLLTAFQLSLIVLALVSLGSMMLRCSSTRRLISWLAIGILISFFVWPTTNFPDYPLLARVVSDDGLAGVIQPWLGEAATFQLLDHFKVSEVLFFPTIFLLFSGLVTVFVSMLKVEDRASEIIPLLLPVFLFFELILPSSLNVLMPTQVISRFIPGSFLYPISVPIFVLALLIIARKLYRFKNESLIFSSLLIIGALVWTTAFSREAIFYTLDQKGFKQSKIVQATASPSWPIIRKHGLHILESASIVDFVDFSTLENLTSSVF